MAAQAIEVEEGVGAALALELHPSRAGHFAGGFDAGRAIEGDRFQGGGLAGYGQVQVDTVEQWAGQFGAVALDLLRAAAAASAGVAEISTGAGVHGRDELETGGKAHLVVGAGDDDLAALQRFAQDLQDLAVELGELVEEEHALVSQGDLAGLRSAATANQRRARGTVVRVAKGPLGPGPQRCVAGHRVDGRHFQRFVFLQGRQQAGEPAGEQGLAGAGRAAEQQVVRAGRGHQQAALGGDLALHLGEVGVGRPLLQQALGLVGRERRMAG
ncbi:hypothetical protein D9M70_359800 [compost metagenome]